MRSQSAVGLWVWAECDNLSISSESSKGQSSLQAQLSVRDGRAALGFYEAAFGAVVLYPLRWH